jgi:hypothetical protein
MNYEESFYSKRIMDTEGKKTIHSVGDEILWNGKLENRFLTHLIFLDSVGIFGFPFLCCFGK